MSANYIYSLPEEILIEIFDYLSLNMVKTCCAVSSRWNTIIDNSGQFMEKLILKLDHRKIEEYKAMPMRQNYQSIWLRSMPKNILNIVNPYTLSSLELTDLDLGLRELVLALNSLSALKVLSLTFLKLNEEKTFEDYGVAKLSLRSLKITRMINIRIEKLVKKLDVTTLQKLAVHSRFSLDYKGLIDFIEQQIELEELSLGYHESAAFFDDLRIFDFKFRLKKLLLIGRAIRDVENFCLFLSIHKDTLETLKLDDLGFGSVIVDIYKYIWNNLSLKTLDVNIYQFNDELNMIYDDPDLAVEYVPKFPVESIKFLGYLEEMVFSTAFLDAFISSLTSVRQLDLKKLNFDGKYEKLNCIIKIISKEMKNLTDLTMPFCNLSVLTPNHIYFPKLEEIHMSQFFDETLCHFIRRHSRTLKKISFDWNDGDVMDILLDDIFNCENLKIINLYVEQDEALSIINRLDSRTKRSKPWRLTVTTEDVRLTYDFPEDTTFWNQHYNRFWEN